MEENILTPSPQNKVYKDKAIWIGTFVGGPLVAGYLIAENFKHLGQEEKIKATWIYTIIATIIIFGGIFLIPESVKIPNVIIPLIYTAIASYIVQRLQGEKIKTHIENGGQLYSNWRALAIGLIGLVITVCIFIAMIVMINKSIL